MSILPILLPPATKLGQGYVFTGVYDSVNGGVPHTPPGADPPEQTLPEQTPGAEPPRTNTPWSRPPGSRHTTPQSRHPPVADTPLEQTPSPRSRHHPLPPPLGRHTVRYGQSAGGTHPTGMQSCFSCAIRKKLDQ